MRGQIQQLQEPNNAQHALLEVQRRKFDDGNSISGSSSTRSKCSHGHKFKMTYIKVDIRDFKGKYNQMSLWIDIKLLNAYLSTRTYRGRKR